MYRNVSVSCCSFALILNIYVHGANGEDCASSACDTNTGVFHWSPQPATRIKEILEQTTPRYNKYILPGQLRNETTNVKVFLSVETLSSFKAATMDFEAKLDLELMWIDERLKVDHPVLLTSKDSSLADMIWQPDIYFANQKERAVHTLIDPLYVIYIYPDGVVNKAQSVHLKFSCGLNLAMFPMDEQECSINIHSYSYFESLLNMSWALTDGEGILFNPQINFGDMYLTGTSYKVGRKNYAMVYGPTAWVYLEARIRMRRYLVYHILQLYLPTTLLVIISWLTFWLPLNIAPARISLLITALLTLVNVANGARDSLPQVSYIKAIDIWNTGCITLLFCSLLEYTLVNCLEVASMSACAEHRANEKKCECRQMLHIHALNIDRSSRILFPSIFLFFTVTYWTVGLAKCCNHISEDKH